MQRDELYLRDIVEAVDSITNFLRHTSREQFVDSELLQSAVLHKLTIIGEAAARISDNLKNRYSEIKWKTIIGFRNIIIHEYFSINWEIVWTAATVETIALRAQVLKIIEQEFLDKK